MRRGGPPKPQRFAVALPPSEEANAPKGQFMAPCQEVVCWPPVKLGSDWWSAGYTTKAIKATPISRGGPVKDAEPHQGFHAFSLKFNTATNQWRAFQQNCHRNEAGAKIQGYRWYCHKAGIPWEDPVTGKAPKAKKRRKRKKG
jgi:hypothetical protein